MGVSDQRRRLLMLAENLTRTEPPEQAEIQYLTNCLVRIANGEDANEVFDLVRGRGHRESDEWKRKQLSLYLHLVRGLVDDGWSVDAACREVAGRIAESGETEVGYDADYLRQCWYNYRHMQSNLRTPYDDDYPY